MGRFKLALKKSEVRAHMYRSQGFKTKEDFWTSVELKRKIRFELRKVTDTRKTLNPANRYTNVIPTENYTKVRNIIFNAVGEPSCWNVYPVAGSAEKSKYTGSTYGDSYSSRCTWRKVYHDFTISAPRTIRIDIESVEGLYNLHCELKKTVQGVKIYKASWIVKKRGYDFNVVSGYIAVNDMASYHSDSVKTAMEGLIKKTTKQIKKILTPDTVIGVKKFREITGACQAGCEHFMAINNIAENTKMNVSDAIEMLTAKGQRSYAEKLRMAIK